MTLKRLPGGWLKVPGGLNNVLVDSIATLLTAGTIEVEFESINQDNSEWDGEMLIKFKTRPSATMVVNTIVSRCRADEIEMENDTTLRLWWD